MSNSYDTSQLSPGQDITRLMYHRDRWAHLFRYTHVLRRLRVGMRLLDVGCGSGEMYRFFRVNRASFKLFVGLDVRGQQIYANQASLVDGKTFFIEHDIAVQPAPTPGRFEDLPLGHVELRDWDLITCFEVIEHIPRDLHEDVLKNLRVAMSSKTRLLISTPCYEEGKHSKSHVVDGEICERTYHEMKELLTLAGLKIKGHWGTFGNQTEIKEACAFMGIDWLWKRLHEYYDHHTMAIILAPLFPHLARNCIWEVTV